MDKCFHPIVGKKFQHFIAFFAQYGEDMEHMTVPIFDFGQNDSIILDFIEINACYPASSFVLFIKITKFDAEYSRLYLIEARVASSVFEHILARGAIVGDLTDRFCQLIVVGGDSSGIAECPQILAGIETMSSRQAKTARKAIAISATLCLGIVFKEQ